MVCLQEHVEESTIIDIWKAIPGSNPGKDRDEFDSFHLLMQNGRIFDLRKYDSQWRWKRASIRKSTLTMWRNAEKEQDSSKWQRQFARVSSVGGFIVHEPRTCCVKITSLRGCSGLNAAFYLNVTIYHGSTFLRSVVIGSVYCTE